MAQASYDVIGIGSAIVDILSRTDDGFIQTHGLVKGTMPTPITTTVSFIVCPAVPARQRAFIR